MLISLDTNVRIFGIIGFDKYCEKIIRNLPYLKIIIPDQIRSELERNLSVHDMKQFYRLIIQAGVEIDYENVPNQYIVEFEQKGLKEADAVIGAFCLWRKVDIIVSYNRDFLKGISGEHYFQVISPETFCKRFDL